MKVLKNLVLASLLLIPLSIAAQVSNPSVIPASPPGSCTAGVPLWAVFSTGTLYICNNGTPTAISGGGGGGVSGSGTSGFIPAWTGTTALGNSHLDDGKTTAATVTSSEPLSVQAHASAGVGSSINGYGGVPSILLLQETQTDGDATALIAALTYNPTVTSAGGQAVYSELDFSLDGTTSADNLSAVDGESYNHSNTVATTEFRGGYFYSDSPGSGSVTNQSGLVAQVDKTGSGNDAQLADAWLQSPSFGLGTGTVTQFDGLRIDQISGATHNYQIYSAGTATSYFHGGMQFDNLPTTAQTSVVGIDSSGNLYKNAASGGYPTPVTQTAAGVSELDFIPSSNPCFSSSYRDYEIRYSDIIISGSSVSFGIQFYTGSYDTGANYYENRFFGGVIAGDAATPLWTVNVNGTLLGPTGSTDSYSTSAAISGWAKFEHPGGTQTLKMGQYSSTGYVGNATTKADNFMGGYVYNNATPVTGFRVITTGTFTGTVTCQPLPQ
jgi:hypothetical protein